MWSERPLHYLIFFSNTNYGTCCPLSCPSEGGETQESSLLPILDAPDYDGDPFLDSVQPDLIIWFVEEGERGENMREELNWIESILSTNKYDLTQLWCGM